MTSFNTKLPLHFCSPAALLYCLIPPTYSTILPQYHHVLCLVLPHSPSPPYPPLPVLLLPSLMSLYPLSSCNILTSASRYPISPYVLLSVWDPRRAWGFTSTQSPWKTDPKHLKQGVQAEGELWKWGLRWLALGHPIWQWPVFTKSGHQTALDWTWQ